MSLSGEDHDFDGVNGFHDGYDDSAHQGCYIFRAADAELEEIDNRPKKRRKSSKAKDTEKKLSTFPKLFGGQESDNLMVSRQEAFENLWGVQQAKIDKIIAESNNGIIEDIARFVRNAPGSIQEGKLPTGLVVVGRDSGVQQRLLKQWQRHDRTRPSEYLVQLDHNQAASIISALKSIIRSVISTSSGQEEYLGFLAKHKRLIPMNHDLELLQKFEEEQQVEKVVVSILDIESFDVGILSNLMTMLASWTDRIPFVLLIGISTTVELFEARLPKSALRVLTPGVFDVSGRAGNPMYEIFMATQHGLDTSLWLGPAVAGILLGKSKEQDTTPEMFGQMIKYGYMTHFFANAMSIWVASDQGFDDDTQTFVCEVVRNTPSFSSLVESLLSASKTQAQQASKLLENDGEVIGAVRQAISESKSSMVTHYKTIHLLKDVVLAVRDYAIASGQQLPKYSAPSTITEDIFTSTIDALKGPRAAESMIEDLGLSETIEKLSSDCFRKVCHDTEVWSLQTGLTDRIDKLHRKSKGEQIHLKPGEPQLTPLQKEYQDIQATFIELLEDKLRENLVDPLTLFPHEAFIYNLKAPLAQVFAPAPRYAIERALDRPVDYLGCECCTIDGGATQPPTAVLWRLWCEAGGVVNVRDLWEAFRSTLLPSDYDEREDAEGEEGCMNERLALTLFYRSLAELQMLGMLKQSKRKPGVECLAKIEWRGL